MVTRTRHNVYDICTMRTLCQPTQTAQRHKKGAPLDKLIQTELVTKLPASYELPGSLPCSKQLINGLLSEPVNTVHTHVSF